MRKLMVQANARWMDLINHRFVKRFVADDGGAALIEYTVLLGVLLVAVIATIAGVGTWVSGKWTNLNGNLK
jgi:pilus assembly protein Flp/PilA